MRERNRGRAERADSTGRGRNRGNCAAVEQGAEQSFTFRCGDGGRRMENDRRKNVSRMNRGSEGETGEG